jgi:starch synthase
MAKNFKILFVSSEVYPFAKESGIADVSHSLPIALRDFGHDVRVISPKYGSISERKSKIHNISRLREVPIEIGDRTVLANIKSSSIYSPKHKVQVYFTTNFDYFEERLGIYHDPITWEEYPDNAERFIFFSKSVLETCIHLQWIPDIVHCNDWQTALIPAFIRSGYSSKFAKTKIVFTIHNFYRQGNFPIEEFTKTGLTKEILKNYEHNGKFNFMKGALHYSNFTTTVSPTYHDEILEDNVHSNGMEKILREKGKTFKGILNGIDNYIWNPQKDKLIHSKLTDDFPEFKYKNKIQLQKIVGLPLRPDIPLYGMIPRIGYQKGTGLFIDSADKIFSEDIQLILLGQGDSELKSQLLKIAQKYPSKFKAIFAFDENLSHQIEAGSDFFLMPSQYEPCGLNLMYSLNYGTIPIVRATGGMKDSGINFDEDTLIGNSIVFDKYDVDDFTKAMFRSFKLYRNKESLAQIINNGISGDYTWKESSKEYDAIYRIIMKE